MFFVYLRVEAARVCHIDAQKRARARQMGAVATTDNSAPDAVKQVMQATGGGAAAAVRTAGRKRRSRRRARPRTESW